MEAEPVGLEMKIAQLRRDVTRSGKLTQSWNLSCLRRTVLGEEKKKKRNGLKLPTGNEHSIHPILSPVFRRQEMKDIILLRLPSFSAVLPHAASRNPSLSHPETWVALFQIIMVHAVGTV